MPKTIKKKAGNDFDRMMIPDKIDGKALLKTLKPKEGKAEIEQADLNTAVGNFMLLMRHLDLEGDRRNADYGKVKRLG